MACRGSTLVCGLYALSACASLLACSATAPVPSGHAPAEGAAARPRESSSGQGAAARDGGTQVDDEHPLLGSARGGHVWSRHCADAPDDQLLPVDPRTLIQPGVNAG